jgi:hypothetical protein
MGMMDTAVSCTRNRKPRRGVSQHNHSVGLVSFEHRRSGLAAAHQRYRSPVPRVAESLAEDIVALGLSQQCRTDRQSCSGPTACTDRG